MTFKSFISTFILASACVASAATEASTSAAPAESNTFQYQFYHTNAHALYAPPRSSCNENYAGGCTKPMSGEGRDIISDVQDPYHMYGKTFVMYSPTEKAAALSYHLNRTTIFAYSENHVGLAYNTFGFATKTFGVSFLFANEYTWQNFEIKSAISKTEGETFDAFYGTYYALRFSMPIGGLDIAAHMMYTTPTNVDDTSYVSKTKYSDGSSTKREYSDNNLQTRIDLTLSNTPSAKKFFWNLSLGARRHLIQFDSSYTEKIYDDGELIETDNDYDYELTYPKSYLNFALAYNFGYQILESRNARVLLGSRSNIVTMFYDEIKDEKMQNKDRHYDLHLNTTPFIYSEYAFSKNWLVFGRVQKTMNLLDYNHELFSQKYDEQKLKQENRYRSIHSGTNDSSVRVSTGFTFKYKKLLMDATVSNDIYANPFEMFSSGKLMYNLGAALFF